MENINEIIKERLTMAQSAKTLRDIFDVIHHNSDRVFCEVTNGFSIAKTTYGEAKRFCYGAGTFVKKHAPQLGEQDGYVGLYGENSANWIYMLWGILMSGYRPLLLNTRLPDSVNGELIRRMGVKTVFATGACTLQDVPIVPVDELSLSPADAPESADEWANHFALSTSATTSLPSVCVYGGESIVQQILNSEWVLKRNKLIKKHYQGCLKVLAFLPFYHVFGLFVVYFWFCYFSRTTVFLKDMRPDTILRTVRRHKVTHIFGVPLLWYEIYKEIIANVTMRGQKILKKFHKGIDLSIRLQSIAPALGRAFAAKAFREVRENLFGDSVHFMISGGGSIYPDALKVLNGIGYPLHNGYGMTEIGITSVELSASARVRCMGSIGKPFGRIQYGVDQQGTLTVAGNSFATEIIGANGARSMERGSAFLTSDIVRTDKRGNYYVLGRSDDVVVTAGGEKINPDTIESRLFFVYAEKFCVIGLPNGKGTDELCLIVKLPEGGSAVRTMKAAEEIESALCKLSKEGVTFGKVYITTDALCSENAIKVSRTHLKNYINRGAVKLTPYAEFKESDAGSPEVVFADTEERITQIFAEIARRDASEILPHQHFIFDLGCSSLNYFTLLTELKRVFCIDFDFSANQNCYSVAAFAGYIHSRYAVSDAAGGKENN